MLNHYWLFFEYLDLAKSHAERKKCMHRLGENECMSEKENKPQSHKLTVWNNTFSSPAFCHTLSYWHESSTDFSKCLRYNNLTQTAHLLTSVAADNLSRDRKSQLSKSPASSAPRTAPLLLLAKNLFTFWGICRGQIGSCINLRVRTIWDFVKWITFSSMTNSDLMPVNVACRSFFQSRNEKSSITVALLWAYWKHLLSATIKTHKKDAFWILNHNLWKRKESGEAI